VSSRAQTPPVTVAIPTANRPHALRRCIAALRAGEIPPAEIVIIDQSRDPAPRLPDATRGGRVPIRHVVDRRRGLSAARNLGLDHAASPIVAFIDDDCVPSRGWVSAIQSTFLEWPAVACVTGPVVPLGGERRGQYAVSSRTGTVEQSFGGDVAPWLVGTGGNMAVRRDALDGEGLFDPRLGTGSAGRAGEDIDALRRMLRSGHEIRYSPAAVVLHDRQSLRQRLRSRFGYGHGVGSAGGLWLRAGDRYAVRMLMQWLKLRVALASGALVELRARGCLEEALVLAGTIRGLLYGAAHGRRRAP
jgi:glycosyltransferase involved in cell wall biosynthesis